MSAARIWGIAVVGSGLIGRLHIRALKDTGRARLVALSSRREDKARAAAAEEGCAFTTDPFDLVRRPDAEIIAITTSSGSHAAIALAAIEAGKHVLVEKPMAMQPADARRMIDAAAARGVSLGVVSQRRFEPTLRAVKAAIDQGAIGKPLLLEAFCPYYRTQEYYDSADWRGTLADDGGALMNQAIHSVDLMLWLGGPAAAVYGQTATQTHRMEAEDMALAIVNFASGAFGTLMASTSIRPGFQAAINVYGEKGSIKLDGTQVAHWSVPGLDPPAAAGPASTGVASPALSSHEHHQAQIADFLDAVEQRRPPVVSGQDGFRAVELVDGVYRSSASRKPVPLSGT